MNTDPRSETTHYPQATATYPEILKPDHPTRMLERMENHAEFITHLSYRLDNILDRLHGPAPEKMNKTATDGCEPRSTMMWQMDKMENQARRLSNLIDVLENTI